jgi:uncharacterized protein YjiS (DUF1127 family)
MKEYIRSLRTECNRCGADNPEVLVFHHTNPETKSCDIGPHLTKERIDEELKKCEIVCFNCHMIIHRRLKTTKKSLQTRQKKAHQLTDIGANIARGRLLKESLSQLSHDLLKDIRKEINNILPKPIKEERPIKIKEPQTKKPKEPKIHLIPIYPNSGFEAIPFGYMNGTGHL